jgi:hypothetical protein
MDVPAIISDIDDHGFEDTSPTRKLAVIQDVYNDVLTREAWPFLEAFIRLTFTGSSDQSNNLPADFRAVLTAKVENGQRLQWMRYDEFERRYGSNTQYVVDNPLVYYFLGNELHFFPAPSSTVFVRMAYIKRPNVLTASGAGSNESDLLLPKEFHRSVLVNGSLYKLYALEDDAELAGGFQTYFEEGLQKMREFAWRKQYDWPEVIETSWDDWS